MSLTLTVDVGTQNLAITSQSTVGKPGAKNGNRDRGEILWQSCWIAWSIQHGIYTIQDNVTTDNKETRYNT
jgi:hypothetical protein